MQQNFTHRRFHVINRLNAESLQSGIEVHYYTKPSRSTVAVRRQLIEWVVMHLNTTSGDKPVVASIQISYQRSFTNSLFGQDFSMVI